MHLHAPGACPWYELDWQVEDGEPVREGTVLAWLCGAGQCALSPLVAPVDGLVWRRTSLLPTAQAGALVAVVGADGSAVRAVERELLERRRDEVLAELASLGSRGPGTPLARALLADDERRLRAWLGLAEGVLLAPGGTMKLSP